RSAPKAFNADHADLDEYLDRFERPDRWPVFAVPIGGGTMHLVVRNFPDDAGIDFLLDAQVQAMIQRLAEETGDYDPGPGLPWPLLPRDPVPLLMALPGVGDRTVPDDVPSVVAQALRAVGAIDLIEQQADELLRHRACVILQ